MPLGPKYDLQELIRSCEQDPSGVEPQLVATLGEHYMNGSGVSKNYAKGLHYLQLAAKANSPKACNDLAECYWTGEGVAKSYAQAQQWLLEATHPRMNQEEENDILCAHLVAIKLYQEDFEKGSPLAQYRMARAYQLGLRLIVKQDLSLALTYLQQAVKQGHQEAAAYQEKVQSCEAPLLLNLEEFKQHRSTPLREFSFMRFHTLENLQQQAENGSAWAQTVLGHCYENEFWVEKDLQQALLWFNRAAEQGETAAMDRLVGIYAEAQDAEGQRLCAYWHDRYAMEHCEARFSPLQAWERWQEAAAQGDAEAQYRLGRYYATGVVGTNFPQEQLAQKLYAQAQQQYPLEVHPSFDQAFTKD